MQSSKVKGKRARSSDSVERFTTLYQDSRQAEPFERTKKLKIKKHVFSGRKLKFIFCDKDGHTLERCFNFKIKLTANANISLPNEDCLISVFQKSTLLTDVIRITAAVFLGVENAPSYALSSRVQPR